MALRLGSMCRLHAKRADFAAQVSELELLLKALVMPWREAPLL